MLTSVELKLVQRGLRAGMTFPQIADLINMSVPSLREAIEADSELKKMFKVIPMQGALELAEAMHANAVENEDAGMQKFLAKNRLGMQDKVEVQQQEVKITVAYEDNTVRLNRRDEDLIEGEYEPKALPQDKSFSDVIDNLASSKQNKARIT